MIDISAREPYPSGLLAVLALCLALLGCGKEPEPETLIVAEAGQAAFGLLYIAEREGYFHDEGLRVNFQRHISGRDTLAAVLAGQADVGTPFDTPVVVKIQQGQPIRVLSTLAVGYGANAIIARRDRGIDQPSDLAGKRIAFVPETSSEYLLSLVLASAGVEPMAIERVAMNPSEATEALIQGRVDAAAIWRPHSQQAEHALGRAAIQVFTSPLYLEAVTLTTREPVLHARAEALHRLLRALVRAEDLALSDPERALAQVTAFLAEYPAADVREAWSKLQPQVRLDNMLLASLRGELDWYARLQTPGKAATAPPDLRPYLATELLQAVRPQAVTLRPAP